MTPLGPDHFGDNIQMVNKNRSRHNRALINAVSHKKSKYRQIHGLTEVTV